MKGRGILPITPSLRINYYRYFAVFFHFQLCQYNFYKNVENDILSIGIYISNQAQENKTLEIPYLIRTNKCPSCEMFQAFLCLLLQAYICMNKIRPGLHAFKPRIRPCATTCFYNHTAFRFTPVVSRSATLMPVSSFCH